MLPCYVGLVIIGGAAILALLAHFALRRLAGRPDKTPYEDSTPTDPPRRVVTLVHGNWPRGLLHLGSEVRWYRSDSAVCRELINCDHIPTLIHRFRWSGANSAAARLDASLRLQSELSELLKDHPDAKHFIVAHSHGGNVALGALRDGVVASRISGVACLATPFMRVSVRPWVKLHHPEERRWIDKLMICGVPLTGAFCLFQLDPASLPQCTPSLIRLVMGVARIVLSLSLVVGGVALGFLALLGSDWIISNLWVRLYDQAVSCVKKMDNPPLRGIPLLVVRPVSDEASAVLTVVQFISWLVGYVDSIVIYSMFPAFIAFAVLGMVESAMTWRWPGMSENVYIVFIFVAVGAALASQVARVIAAWLFGLPLAKFTPLLDISAEFAPPGTWTVRQLPPREIGRFSLHHSTPDDPAAAEAVADWLLNPR